MPRGKEAAFDNSVNVVASRRNVAGRPQGVSSFASV